MYSVYEWGMMVADTLFDAAALVEFVGLTITVNVPVPVFAALAVEKAEAPAKSSSVRLCLLRRHCGLLSVA